MTAAPAKHHRCGQQVDDAAADGAGWISAADRKRGLEGGLWYQGMSRVCPGCPQTSPRELRKASCIQDAYGESQTTALRHPSSNLDEEGGAESWETHGSRTFIGASPGTTFGLPGAPSASAELRNIGQAHGKRAEGGFPGLGLLGKNCQSAADTSSACSAGFTAGQIFLILPSGPIRKVTRWVPSYLRPMKLFTPQTP